VTPSSKPLTQAVALRGRGHPSRKAGAPPARARRQRCAGAVRAAGRAGGLHGSPDGGDGGGQL